MDAPSFIAGLAASFIAGLAAGRALVLLMHAARRKLGRHNAKSRYHAFDRITVDPEQMGGEPCIRHLRIPVVTAWKMTMAGMTVAEVRRDFPDLTRDDLRQALAFVHAAENVVAESQHYGRIRAEGPTHD